MKLLSRHEFTQQYLGLLFTAEETLMLERWALQAAALTLSTYEVALSAVKRFYRAGGDEELFLKLRQLVAEKGYDFIFLLNVVVDVALLKPVVKVNQ